MLIIKNDKGKGSYIKSYVRQLNNTNSSSYELKYTKYDSKVPIKNSKYLTNSLELTSYDDNNNQLLIPTIECNKVSEDFCTKINNLIWEIEVDIRKNIVINNPINFQIKFADPDDKFESEKILADTFISAYYCLRLEEDGTKYNYPQALVKQFLTDKEIQYTEFDFVITLSQNENSYILNASELQTKNKGYDLKLILYHEIMHGLGIKSEANSFPNYLETTYGVNPEEYTTYINDDSYLWIMMEPTIYDSFIRNEAVSRYSLAEEMSPLVDKFPELQERIGKLEKQQQVLYTLTNIIGEVVETNATVLNGAWRAYGMVTQKGLYFKGNNYDIPLHVAEHSFESGVSLTHTRHYENAVEGDKILLDWSIPNGKLLIDNTATTNNIMGEEILDMLDSIGWLTVNENNQAKYTVEESINIFSLFKSEGYSISIPIVTIFNICILLS